MKKLISTVSLLLMISAVLSCVFLCQTAGFAEVPVYVSSDGQWMYSLINGNEAYLTSASTTAPAYLGSDKDIYVPSYIDGYKVTGMSKYTFYSIEGIRSISVPDTMQRNSLNFETDLPAVEDYYCYKGSGADRFAKQNSFLSSKIRYLGDVDADGDTDLSDYSLILSYITDSESTDLDPRALRAADYDTDTSIDAFDLYYLGRVVNASMKVGNNDDDSHYAIIEWG